MPIIKTLVEDNEKYKKDPQGFLKKVVDNAERMNNFLQKEKFDELNKQISELQSKALNGDMDAAKQYVNLLGDMSDLQNVKNAEDMESYIMREFLRKTMIELQIMDDEYMRTKKVKTYEFVSNVFKVVPGSRTEFYKNQLKKCESTPNTNFTTKNDACEFLKWVNSTHTGFTWFYGEIPVTGVETCDSITRKSQPEWYLINNCEIKEAFLKYKDEYLKSITTTQTTTQPTKKYKCIKNTCVEDPNGRYVDSICGGNCPQPHLP
jgi:hypothetical protein